MIYGIASGIEKANKIMMPLFFLMFIGMAVYIATLPGASEGYRYLANPDWSVLAQPETPAPDNTSNQEPAAYTAAPMPSSAAVARSQKIMDGTWVQQDSTNLENYMDAVIHDGIIEVTYHLNHEELATPFWVGTFEAKDGNFSYISRVDRAKLARAPYASDKETKEFTMENGVLSFPMTFEGATRIIHLEKQHS